MGYEHLLFILLRIQDLDGGDPHMLIDEQLSVILILETHTVITIHETKRLEHVFEPARSRLSLSNTRIRRECHATWFVYVVVDAVIDVVFEMAQAIGARMQVSINSRHAYA